VISGCAKASKARQSRVTKENVDTDDKQQQKGRWQRRARHAQETMQLVRRLRQRPTLEDAILLHELHAQHERELGHDQRADEADARAEAARLRLQTG
jgi:hypothetical protein